MNVEHVRALRDLSLRVFFLNLASSAPEVDGAPSVLLRDYNQLIPGDVLVMAEPVANILSKFRTDGLVKICHNQNPYYTFLSYGTAEDYRAAGVSDLLCCTHFTRDQLSDFGFDQPMHVVRPFIDVRYDVSAEALTPSTFAARGLTLAYMPRKRGLEGKFIIGALRSRHPRHADIRLVKIEDMDRNAVADALKSSQVFLSLSQIEGLGLPPLEAMRAGALVCGFHGGGGQEYATDANGHWFEDGDLMGIVDRLADIFDRIKAGDYLVEMRRNAYETAGEFSRENFLTQLEAAWRAILGDRYEDYVVPERERWSGGPV